MSKQFNHWRLTSQKCNCKCKNGIRINFLVLFTVNDRDTGAGYTQHDVKVSPDAYGFSSPNLWFLGSSSFGTAPYKGVVHEVGHKFGLGDEYYSYGDDPTVEPPSDAEESIMYDLGGNILQRHIGEIVEVAGVNKKYRKCNFQVEKR